MVLLDTMDNAQHRFTFDRVFDTESNQAEVYEYVGKPIVDAVCEGYNACLLAYGQTGAGKTHTMSGPDIDNEVQRGIIPRVAAAIFEFAANADECIEFTVQCSYVEIYMERVRDLLDPSKTNLSVKEDPSTGVYVKDATEMFVVSSEEMLELMRRGNDNRATASTGMNEESSRSHSLLLVQLNQKNTETGLVKRGRLFLVDLAGSETVNKTGVKGVQLEEAKKINKSLSALGNVINSLTDGRSSHIPYRDSKLTRVLQEGLGGNARTTLILNCSPSAFNEMETLSTLRFGRRAKRIRNRAKVNKERSPEEMKRYIVHLEAEVERLQQREVALVDALGGPEVATRYLRTSAGAGEPPAAPGADASAGAGAAGTADVERAQDIASVREQLEIMETLLQEAKDANAALRETIAEKETQLSAKTDEMEDREERIESLERELRDARRRSPSAADARESASHVDDAEKDEAKEHDEDEGGSDSGNEKNADLEILRRNYHLAIDENQNLRAEMSQLESQASQQEEETEKLKAEMAALQSQRRTRPLPMPGAQGEDAAGAAAHDDIDMAEVEEEEVVESVWEKQRHVLRVGWTGELEEGDGPTCAMGSDASMQTPQSRDDVALPSPEWQWLDDWIIDKLGDVDGGGWSYGRSFAELDKPRSSEEARGAGVPGNQLPPRSVELATDVVRRRRWIRTRARVHLPSVAHAERYILSVRREMEAMRASMEGMATELTRRQSTINDYEERLVQLTTSMANAASTGDIQMLRTTSNPMVRSLRGGGGTRRMAALGAGMRTPSKTGGDKSTSGGSTSASSPFSAIGSVLSSIGRRLSPQKSIGSGSPTQKREVADACKAAFSGDVQTLVSLYEAHGLSLLCQSDAMGRPPLLHAARAAAMGALQYLVSLGCPLDATDSDGRNALHYAARKGETDVVRWLVEQANMGVNVADSHAITPLHQAVLGKSPAVISFLLESGGDVNARDANGRTAWKLALRFGRRPDDPYREEWDRVIECVEQWIVEHSDVSEEAAEVREKNGKAPEQEEES